MFDVRQTIVSATAELFIDVRFNCSGPLFWLRIEKVLQNISNFETLADLTTELIENIFGVIPDYK